MKFKSMDIGQYTTADGAMHHAVYGLTEQGNIFKYERNNGWVQLKDKKTSARPKLSRASSTSSAVEDDDVPF